MTEHTHHTGDPGAPLDDDVHTMDIVEAKKVTIATTTVKVTIMMTIIRMLTTKRRTGMKGCRRLCT